ncbi:MAG: cupin domain-containing protein [bacterium]|nr:cupin domain-containing protein [bacterium]
MSDAATSLAPAVRELVERLALVPHPEGGFFRETWRSPIELAAESLPEGYPGPRAAMTSILFLLPTGASSALHRVRSEELWLHHQGDAVELGIGPTIEAARAEAGRSTLGQDPAAVLQAIVPAGHWQTARALEGPAGYALVGCVVSPGFDFDDFEMLDDGSGGSA